MQSFISWEFCSFRTIYRKLFHKFIEGTVEHAIMLVFMKSDFIAYEVNMAAISCHFVFTGETLHLPLADLCSFIILKTQLFISNNPKGRLHESYTTKTGLIQIVPGPGGF